MKICIKIVSILFFASAVSSCDYLLGNNPSDSPLATFDYFWTRVDTRYVGFITKTIDWDSVRETYRPQIEANNTEENLNNVMRIIADSLQDGHFRLYNQFGVYPAIPSAVFKKSLILGKYVTDGQNDSTGYLFYGDISADVGYLYIKSFGMINKNKTAPWIGNVEAILDKFSSKKFLIVDFRKNSGGEAEYMRNFASCFLKSDVEAYKVYEKNGPARNDYSVCSEVICSKKRQDSFAIILLVSEETGSAGDIGTLILKNHCAAVLIGNENRASLMGVDGFTELPNGWSVRFGTVVYFCFPFTKDGDMIPVDVEVNNAAADIDNGKDSQLEEAISWAASH